MSSGGARIRSGPERDPNSARSEKAGAKDALTALPSEGYKRRPPAFPLPRINRYDVDGFSASGTKAFRDRELAIWREIWKTPQAVAWSTEPYRWPTIGEFCRVKAAVELDAGSNASLVSRLREYRNEIGLSPDGLKTNGWAISTDEVAKQATKKAAAPAKKTAPTRRLRSVGGAASS